MKTDGVDFTVLYNPGCLQGEEIRVLLGHKGDPWMAHAVDFQRRADTGLTEGLESRFFLAKVGGRPVANVTLWDDGQCGIVGHVFTAESERGKGLARLLFERLLGDAQARGVGSLCLNVAPESFQQRFYEQLGFVPILGVAGAMRRDAAAAEAVPSSLHEEAFRWADWPGLNRYCLAEQCAERGWKGVGLAKRGSLEFPLLDYAYTGGGDGELHRGVVVLRRGPAVVGWVSLLPWPVGAAAGERLLEVCGPPEAMALATACAMRLVSAIAPPAIVCGAGVMAGEVAREVRDRLWAEEGRSILLNAK